MPSWVTKMLQPLRSRGVRTALVTVIVAFAANYGLELNETTIGGIVAVGVALILKTGIEDAGVKANPTNASAAATPPPRKGPEPVVGTMHPVLYDYDPPGNGQVT